MQQWTITIDGADHVVVYQGKKWGGSVKVLIDGVFNEYIPTTVKGVGTVVKLDVSGRSVILHLGEGGREAQLAVDGVYVDNNMPVDEQLKLGGVSVEVNDNAQLQKKTKAGYGSLLTFVVLSYINLLLLLMDVDISFPFSAMLPQIVLVFGQLFYLESGMFAFYIIGIVASLFLVSAYLLFFFLAKRWTAPLYITLVFIVIDTIILLVFAMDDITSSMIDIAFHGWVIWSMVGLIRSRVQLNRITRNEVINSVGMGEAEPHI